MENPKEEYKSGYIKSDTEFLGVNFILKDGFEQFVPNLKEEPKQETLEEYTPQDFLNEVCWNNSKQETLEEVAHKILSDYVIKSMGQSIGVLEVNKLMVKLAKWQAEKMYSDKCDWCGKFTKNK